MVLNDTPSSTMTVRGDEQVGSFRYLAAENGKVKPNQIRNTAIGNIMPEKNIAEYFKTALFDESRFVGVKMGTGPIVKGQINDVLIDDPGYSIDWTLDVGYQVLAADSSTPCYSDTKVLKKHTAKFANAFGTLNEVMKENIEKLFEDPAFVRCITPAQTAAVCTPQH